MTLKTISRVSYGGMAAIVTSMALITGLKATGTAKPTLITALLIVALADNITDSLSIHIYQLDSETFSPRQSGSGGLFIFGLSHLEG